MTITVGQRVAEIYDRMVDKIYYLVGGFPGLTYFSGRIWNTRKFE